MTPYHLQHKIPWNTLHEILETKGKIKIESIYSGIHSYGQKPPNDESVFKRIDYFCHCFGNAVLEFSETEIRKYDSRDIDTMKEIYPDNQCSRLLLKEYQTAEAWNKYLSDNISKTTDDSPVSCGGELCEIIKELFNKNNMMSLLHLARAVIDIDKLAFVTNSNFFHWGYRRVLEDAMTLYFLLNFIFNKSGYELRRWKMLNAYVSKDTKYDTSLHYYRKLLLGENNIYIENDRIYSRISEDITLDDLCNDKVKKVTHLSDEQINQAQKFAFRTIYQYNVFWNEVLKYSKNRTLKPIDWHDEIVNCLNSLLM